MSQGPSDIYRNGACNCASIVTLHDSESQKVALVYSLEQQKVECDF